jgi:uncharacterized protein YjdB
MTPPTALTIGLLKIPALRLLMSGLVTGIAEGSVKIRLVANDGSVFGEAAITVNNPETVQV